MESYMERCCSRRMCTPLMLGGVVIAFDALKPRDIHDFKSIITEVLKREDMIQQARTITLLGALDKVLHPMGFKIQVGNKSFVGAHARAIEEEVSRQVDSYVSLLQHSAEECEEKGVEILVKIIVGAPLMNVLVEEISALHATWAILDRQIKKESRCYLKQILPCKVAQIRDNLTVEIVRPYQLERGIQNGKHKLVYSLSKAVPLPPAQDYESDAQSLISLPVTPMIRSNTCPTSSMEQLVSLNNESATNPQQEASGCQKEIENKRNGYTQVMQKDRCAEAKTKVSVPNCASVTRTGEGTVGSSFSEMKIEPGEYSSDTSPEEDDNSKAENKHDDDDDDKILRGSNGSDAPLLRVADKMSTSLDSLGCSYANVQAATDNFAFDNYIGEGGYGIVYKGKLNDGQFVAVKMQKGTKAQSCAEFLAEVYPLSFARHTNTVTLLGYCCKGNLRILIYEYICNKSLEWHLFDNATQVLDWNQRYNIGIGAAKGLRFLHEECRGSPIIHCNIRPSNILLTNEFVPMLGDFGLATFETSRFDNQRKLVGNLGYVAPECTENGVRCVKADVYAFGILLMQLISGRRAVDSTRDNEQQFIRKWALSLIKTLTLHELVDTRLGDAYCKYELYNMARAAYLCVQTQPESRPTMREVLRILEGTNDHLRHVKSNLYPMIISSEASLY